MMLWGYDKGDMFSKEKADIYVNNYVYEVIEKEEADIMVEELMEAL
jgi:hypothetical protein